MGESAILAGSSVREPPPELAWPGDASLRPAVPVRAARGSWTGPMVLYGEALVLLLRLCVAAVRHV